MAFARRFCNCFSVKLTSPLLTCSILFETSEILFSDFLDNERKTFCLDNSCTLFLNEVEI